MSSACKRCGGSGVVPIFPGGGFGLNPGNRPSGTDECPACRGSREICGCGHPVSDCAPERCSHPYARDAMWGNS